MTTSIFNTKCKRGGEELKGHITQVLCGGYSTQERDRRTQESHNAHSGWWVSMHLRQGP